MKWGVEQRLEFIEFQLFWEDGVNRSDIIDQFGVSVPQASKDLSQYQQLALKNVWYDKSEKRYRATNEFEPVLFQPDPTSYLAQLNPTSNADGNKPSGWLSTPPSSDRIVTLTRNISVVVLRTIVSGIRNQSALDIHYQSMSPSSPGPEWRAIFAHAFGFDGLRWHVRAYCYRDNKYKDFLLSRILGARLNSKEPEPSERDDFWSTHLDVILVPNPKLTDPQQKIVATDYGMKAGQLKVPVRKAMLYYFWKRFRFDVASSADNPHEVPVVIKNHDVFDQALAEAMS